MMGVRCFYSKRVSKKRNERFFLFVFVLVCVRTHSLARCGARGESEWTTPSLGSHRMPAHRVGELLGCWLVVLWLCAGSERERENMAMLTWPVIFLHSGTNRAQGPPFTLVSHPLSSCPIVDHCFLHLFLVHEVIAFVQPEKYSLMSSFFVLSFFLPFLLHFTSFIPFCIPSCLFASLCSLVFFLLL